VSAIPIAPLREPDILAVAKLHHAELPYSFNSQLSVAHLARIYRIMCALPDCFVGVATDAGVPVGVVSGTRDVRGLKPAILKGLGWHGKLAMIGGLLRKPSAVFTLLEEMKSRPPIKSGEKPVNACLTTIAVVSSHRRQGLATHLVSALEGFFRSGEVTHYWLDTIVENSSALAFYRKQGFAEVFVTSRTVVLLKELRSENSHGG